MQLECETTEHSAMRACAASVRCPHCGDWMVAPVMSEFVKTGEIRHHWECDSCRQAICTIIPLDS